MQTLFVFCFLFFVFVCLFCFLFLFFSLVFFFFFFFFYVFVFVPGSFGVEGYVGCGVIWVVGALWHYCLCFCHCSAKPNNGQIKNIQNNEKQNTKHKHEKTKNKFAEEQITPYKPT